MNDSHQYLNIRRTRSRSGSTGAMSELLVAADLIKRGFDVFRAVQPNAACDLIAMKNDKCIRVEVRTAMINKRKDGTETFHVTRRGVYDVLAMVVHLRRTYEITYAPLLDAD